MKGPLLLVNRLVWDLRYDPPGRVAFRTTPPDNPHIWEEPRFKGRDTRPLVHWGIEAAQVTGPIVTPGKFGVRLRIAGQIFTKPLEVLKDPSIGASDADLAASTAIQIRVRDAMTAAAEMVNNLEIIAETDRGPAERRRRPRRRRYRRARRHQQRVERGEGSLSKRDRERCACVQSSGAAPRSQAAYAAIRTTDLTAGAIRTENMVQEDVRSPAEGRMLPLPLF